MSDDILLRVLAEINKSEVKPPPGFIRLRDWQAKWKTSRRQTLKYIRVAIAKGILEKQEFRTRTKTRCILVPFYGPPQKPPRKSKNR